MQLSHIAYCRRKLDKDGFGHARWSRLPARLSSFRHTVSAEHPGIGRPHVLPTSATNVKLRKSDTGDGVAEESKDEEDATSAPSRVSSTEGPPLASLVLALSSFT